MSLIDSFWCAPSRENPRRSRHTTARASRGGHTAEEKALQRRHDIEAAEPEGRLVNRLSYVAPHGELGFMPVKASGGRLSTVEWAKANKVKTVAGAATLAGLLAYMMKPSTASATVIAPPQAPATDPLGKALGIGAFVAVAAGVALYASEDRPNPESGTGGLALGATAVGTAGLAWAIFGDHRDAAPPPPPGVWMVLRGDVTAAENAATTAYQRSALNASQVHNGAVGAYDDVPPDGVNLQFQRQFKGWSY